MKMKLSWLAVLLALTLNVAGATGGATPPAEKLLPMDTLALISVPDWDAAADAARHHYLGQLWNDPAMSAFTGKFYAKLNEEGFMPLEQELGIKLSDYAGLVHGQMTVAVIPKRGESDGKPDISVVAILDSKDKAEALKKALADVKKRWVDAGKKVKTEMVRDVEFTTLVGAGQELNKLFNKAYSKGDKPAADDDADKADKGGLTYAMRGSLLLVAAEPKDFEKVLATQSGGLAETLADQPAFQANQSALFRDAFAFGWVNIKPIIDMGMKAIGDSSAADANPLGLKPDKILDALGLTGLKTIGLAASQSPEGTQIKVFVSAPESSRKGLMKLFATESPEYGPPPFVGADSVGFSRVRIDGKKAYATLETMVKELSPQLFGFAQMTIEAAGKDRDPNFDLRKNLIGNLGDDIITYSRSPKGAKPEVLEAGPTLVLVGSPNAPQLASAIQTVASLGAAPSGEPNLKEREFLGRKIYSLPPTRLPWVEAGAGEAKPVQFAASGGYVAFSKDAAMLEEYLRSAETTAKPLRAAPGLNEAMQKVGGPGTYLFGYQNQAEGWRRLFEVLKADPDALQKLSRSNPLTAAAASQPQNDKRFKELFDFSLLPPFERVAKYFYFTVYGANTSSDGLYFRLFEPTPPELKK